MHTKRNVGGLDRVIRGLLGVLFVAVAVDAAIDDRPRVAAATGLVGIGFLLNVVTGFCAANGALGIDTCSRNSRP